MSDFKGKNKFKNLKNQMIYRARYETEAYAETPQVKDTNFAENLFYGSIDLDGSAIYPNPDRIKEMSVNYSEPSTFFALDFVAKMFQDVKENIALAINFREVTSDNQIIQRMQPVRAYEPPLPLYQLQLRSILISYNNYLKQNIQLQYNITSLDTYVKGLFDFFVNFHKKSAITFTKWISSGRNSLFSTGLAIAIADIPYDDDDKKYEEFINSNVFPYYARVCMNRGFSIHKSCPYILIADLGSPAIIPYIGNTNTSVLVGNIILYENKDRCLVLFSCI